MIKLIICDWNRTLFEDFYEDVFFKGLFKTLVANYLVTGKISKTMNLLAAKKECAKLYSESRNISKEESSIIEDVIEIMNKNMIKGIPVKLLDLSTNRYAIKATKRLDERLLRPLKKAHSQRGVRIGVISSGYVKGINKTLANKGYNLDFIEANDFVIENSIASRFNLRIFKNKKEIFTDILRSNSVTGNETAYIGDDWQDLECLKIVGYPIVSFMAQDKFKDHCLQELKAFIPKSEQDFDNYLQHNISD